MHVEILPATGTCTVRSVGLRDAGLTEIEVVECPDRLTEVASNIVLQVARNGLKTPNSLGDGKTIAGRFADANQPLLEAFRFVQVKSDMPVLRILDRDSSAQGFPHRLVGTHLCATAGMHPTEAKRLLLVSIEVWPRERVASNASLNDYELNPNNFWSWIDLGTTLWKSRQREDAVASWKTAVCMWPRGGKFYAKRMLARASGQFLFGGATRFAKAFWQSVSNATVADWCVEHEVELPEQALAD